MKYTGNISPIQKRINGSEKLFSEISDCKETNFINELKESNVVNNPKNFKKLEKNKKFKKGNENKNRGQFLKKNHTELKDSYEIGNIQG